MDHKVVTNTYKGCGGWCWHHDIVWQVPSQLHKPGNRDLSMISSPFSKFIKIREMTEPYFVRYPAYAHGKFIRLYISMKMCTLLRSWMLCYIVLCETNPSD